MNLTTEQGQQPTSRAEQSQAGTPVGRRRARPHRATRGAQRRAARWRDAERAADQGQSARLARSPSRRGRAPPSRLARPRLRRGIAGIAAGRVPSASLLCVSSRGVLVMRRRCLRSSTREGVARRRTRPALCNWRCTAHTARARHAPARPRDPATQVLRVSIATQPGKRKPHCATFSWYPQAARPPEHETCGVARPSGHQLALQRHQEMTRRCLCPHVSAKLCACKASPSVQCETRFTGPASDELPVQYPCAL